MPLTTIQSPAQVAQAAHDAAQAAQAAAQAAAQGAAAAPALAQGGSVPALRQELTQLRVQLAGLKAQWGGLQDQLQSMRLDNPARPPVQHQAADIGVQMAQVEGRIATIEAQLSGVPGGVLRGTRPAIPPFARGGGMDPDAVTAISIVFILAVLMPVAIGFGRLMWRRAVRSSERLAADPMLGSRMERLEQSIDTIAIEVERISEGQRFITKILAERSGAVPATASNDASPPGALGDPPLRALGAGPIEPIRVGERQAVRSSVTPH